MAWAAQECKRFGVYDVSVRFAVVRNWNTQQAMDWDYI